MTIAHLLGDFVLQPSAWIEDKELRQVKSKYLWIHLLAHGALVFLPTQSWTMSIVVAASHGLIDVTKLYRQRDETRRRWFYMDQALHIAALAGIMA